MKKLTRRMLSLFMTGILTACENGNPAQADRGNRKPCIAMAAGEGNLSPADRKIKRNYTPEFLFHYETH